MKKQRKLILIWLLSHKVSVELSDKAKRVTFPFSKRSTDFLKAMNIFLVLSAKKLGQKI